MDLVTALGTAERKLSETLTPHLGLLEDSEPCERDLRFPTLQYLDGGLAAERLKTEFPGCDGEREMCRSPDLEVDVVKERLRQTTGLP